MGRKRISSQELYTLIDQYLQEIKETLIEVEKKYFSLNPIFDTLNIRLNNLMITLKKKKYIISHAE